MKNSSFVIQGSIKRLDEIAHDFSFGWPTAIPLLTPTDPLFSSQWHLNNTGSNPDINILSVWDDYTGAGVIVGVVDDGVQYTHPDLTANYNTSIDRDEDQNDNNAAPVNVDDNHGTAVAGVIGAAQNSIDVVGVAFGATIAGLRMGFESNDGPDQPQDLFNHAVANGFDVLNNSWGYGGFFQNSDDFNNPAFSGLGAALENLADNGRGGLGTVVVFSSGNDGDHGQDANYHNLLNSRFTIPVGAMDSSGNLTSFSTPGAPVFVVLPGQGIVTTDRTGTDGYVTGNTVSISGTSFSSPIGAGIAALLLEANPGLGWRDVQEIFVLSATQIQPSHSAWDINGTTIWNGGGLHTSRWHGFGLTDTEAAVRLAETWTLQSTSANETSVTGSSSPNTTIADLSTITDTITIPTGVNIDHVEVTLNLSHTAPVDLVVTLISPDGTESQLIVQPGLVPGSDTTPSDGQAGDDGVPAANISFTLSSTEFWGETGAGTWTLRVQDTLTQDSGTLNSWSLRLWGDPLSDDTTYYFTNEYAAFASSDTSRQTITDTTGINTINAAAVSGNLVIDLTGAGPSTIAATSLTLGVGSVFHHAYAGDGNDTLIGNAFDNTLFGGRGNDGITGNNGTDTVVYLSNSTEFTFTLVSPTEIQVAYTGTSGIDEGTDLVTGVELFQFGDTTLTKSQVEALAGGGGSVINGTPLNDILVGTSDAEEINGLGGNDRITGGAGIDQLNGGGGDDVFLVGVGDTPDIFDGGTGTDTIAAIESGVGISFADGLFGPSNSIELITNDAPTSSGFLFFGGTSGDDVIDASAETVPVFIDGLGGRDTLIGGSADDALAGGTSNDNLTGNGGADTFIIVDGTGREVITDFDTASGDVINLSGVAGLNNFADVQAVMTFRGGNTRIATPAGDTIIIQGIDSADLSADDFDFGTAPTPASISASPAAAVANTTIEGTTGTDNYDFSATDLDGITAINMNGGDDTVTGSSEADVINGDAGNDTITGGGGNDTIDGGADTDTAVFSGNRADYTPTQIDGDSLTITGPDGTDTVHNVENFQFDDQTVSFSDLLAITFVPTFTSGTASSFAENAVGVAHDADAIDLDSAAPTYAITGGADAALFTINTVTGEVSFIAPPDFEVPGDVGGNNVYDIEITASSGGDNTAQNVSITVTNENDNAPAFTSGTTATFAEGGTGTVFTAAATDVDGETPTFSISGGADAALFTINTATGEVSFIAPPDFEAPADSGGNNVYDVDITASDGVNTATQSVAVTVTDVSGPPAFTSGTTANFAENGTGTAYDANATSPDGPAPTFSISGGADAALFTINTATGEVAFAAPPDFESPSDTGGNNVYDIEITANSSGLLATQTVAITVTNENDVAPAFTSGTTASFAENGFGTAYDADATDADGDTPTFAITGGADAVLFNINSATGEVSFILSPDFEAPTDAGGDNTYNIEVTASDGVNSTPQSVAITVTDIVNEFNVINGTTLEDDLVGTSAADQINGLGGNDRITGGAGVDQLNGGGGDDVFLVGVGDTPDVFNGGTGTDTIAATEPSVGISFAGGVFGPANSIEVITNDAPSAPGGFTELTGTPGDDTLDASAETTPFFIEGLDGRDTLIGGSADDVLVGGTSNDHLTGNDGADTFVIADGTGREVITDFDTASGDVINLSGVSGLNSFADVQANMTFRGGNTRISTPAGDTIIIQGVDSAVLSSNDFEFGPAPTPSSLSASPAAAVANTTIEGTTAGDSYDFSATVLNGITAINMNSGNDSVTGSSAADTINGDAGNDTITGGGGNDTIDGGSDTDTAVFSGNRANYTPTQIDGDSLIITGPDGTDTVHNVENFQFDDQTVSFADLLGITFVPTFTSGTASSFAENAVGVAHDADAIDLDSAAPTYAITGGMDAALFTINTITGEITFNSAPDFETPLDANTDNVYEIEITASSNGDNTAQNVSITVTNENDNTPVITSGTAVNFAENGSGTAYDTNATDADGDALTYSISGGADASLFSINTATGEVTFNAPPDFETPLDAGSDNTYNIDVTASDGTTSDTASVAVTVTDVDESGPSFTSLTGTPGDDTLDASAETTPFFIEGLDGRDTLIGGSADDVLVGGTSNDRLTGNSGADTFVIADGTGREVITDFDTASGDVINLSGVSGLNSFADVQASMTFRGGNTRISTPAGDTIVIQGVDIAALSSDDFDFGVPPSPTSIESHKSIVSTDLGGPSTSQGGFIWPGAGSIGLISTLTQPENGNRFTDSFDPGVIGEVAALDWNGEDGFVWNGSATNIDMASTSGPAEASFKADSFVMIDPVRARPVELDALNADDFHVLSQLEIDIDKSISDALDSLHLGFSDHFIL